MYPLREGVYHGYTPLVIILKCTQVGYICIYICMVRPSPARRYIQCTATRDIFRRPHEETSALSGTTCIIIAESDTLGLRSCVSQNLSRERPSTLIAILVMLPLYLECLAIESSEQRKASGTL